MNSRAVGEPAQLVDRDDPRVLELAADLGLLDEPADHLGVVAVLLQDDLDGQVAAEVDVAALEDRPHAAAGDLADELVAAGVAGEVGHLRGAGLTGRSRRRAVAEQGAGRADGSLRPSSAVRDEAVAEAEPEQALRAEPGGRVRRLLGTAMRTGVLGRHMSLIPLTGPGT